MIEAAAAFEAHLWESEFEVVDVDGTHSEFSQTPPLHGQKVNFDNIPTDSPLFDEWVEVTAEAIDYLYPGNHRPRILVATAYGTNRLAGPVAKRLGGDTIGLETKKNAMGMVVVTSEAYRRINSMRPPLAVVLDDVGTTGRNAADAAYSTRVAGAQKVDVLYTWQRQAALDKLTGNFNYHAIIRNFLPTFTAKECHNNPEGLCAKGWYLNPYERAS